MDAALGNELFSQGKIIHRLYERARHTGEIMYLDEAIDRSRRVAASLLRRIRVISALALSSEGA